MVLKGHRSIVNQVRFNPDNQLLLSSGVEKIIKVSNLRRFISLLYYYYVTTIPKYSQQLKIPFFHINGL